MVGLKDKKVPEKIPFLTMVLIFLSVLLAGGAGLFVFLPQYREIERIGQERVSVIIDLKRQEKLYPVFAQAQALAAMDFEPGLPMVERSPLDRSRIETLTHLIGTVALSNNMAVSGNNIDIRSLKSGTGSVSMAFTLTGNLADYRNCLISFASLPFFNGIEALRIMSSPGPGTRFDTKIEITIENGTGNNETLP